MVGKTLDSTCPMGPYIVPKDDIPDFRNLAIKLWLNGNLMQSSTTANMIFDVPGRATFTIKASFRKLLGIF